MNSAHYVLPRRVNNILQGVKIVGMKGLRNLLYSYGAQKILGEKYAEMKTLWDHSYRTAFYSFLLARSFKPKADILDDVYVAGILHDLGQIIVTYLHPKAMEQMARFCKDKDIPLRILERFSFGLNHADIGALIARKWNFPEQLVQGIRHHHEPLVTPLQYKDVVYCVYLGQRVLRPGAGVHHLRAGGASRAPRLRHPHRGAAQERPGAHEDILRESGCIPRAG